MEDDNVGSVERGEERPKDCCGGTRVRAEETGVEEGGVEERVVLALAVEDAVGVAFASELERELTRAVTVGAGESRP